MKPLRAPQKESTVSTTANQSRQAINMWVIVSELGFIIAIPLVALLLVGIKVDAWLHTTPLFMIVAVIVSPVLSGIAVWRKIRRLNSLSS